MSKRKTKNSSKGNRPNKLLVGKEFKHVPSNTRGEMLRGEGYTYLSDSKENLVKAMRFLSRGHMAESLAAGFEREKTAKTKVEKAICRALAFEANAGNIDGVKAYLAETYPDGEYPGWLARRIGKIAALCQ